MVVAAKRKLGSKKGVNRIFHDFSVKKCQFFRAATWAQRFFGFKVINYIGSARNKWKKSVLGMPLQDN